MITTDTAALLNAGLKHQQAGHLAEAEACYRRVLAAQPDHADALHLLGGIAHQAGRHELAAEFIGEAIKRDRRNPIYFFNLGVALEHQGKLDDAVAAYRKAICFMPDDAEFHSNLGNVLKELRRPDEALASCDKALALRPDYAEACYNRGNALKELRRLDEALASYHQAIVLKPDYAEAFNNHGNALKELGLLNEALASYGKAIALKPDYAEAFNNHGTALQKLKRLDEALASYDRALTLKPDYAEACNNRGVALKELKQFEVALASYDKALALKPGYAEALSNRGNALQELKRFDDALASYDQALALKPDNAEAFSNRGNALKELRRFDEALTSFEKAIALKPDYADAHLNESFVRLVTGDFARGWAESEWRWKSTSSGLEKRKFARPLWLGAETIDGKTILLHSEQGLGDTIQFCRYIPLVAARGARVIVEVEEPLRRLVSGLAGVLRCVSRTEAQPDFDLHCPLLSLPLAFRTRLETIPSTTPYLSVPAYAPDWAARLGPKDRLRIGVARAFPT